MTDVAGDVIVIGAGITGLTVAHELAERGWRVHVIERAPDTRRAPDRVPACGGIARSQMLWVRKPDPQPRSVSASPRLVFPADTMSGLEVSDPRSAARLIVVGDTPSLVDVDHIVERLFGGPVPDGGVLGVNGALEARLVLRRKDDAEAVIKVLAMSLRARGTAASQYAAAWVEQLGANGRIEVAERAATSPRLASGVRAELWLAGTNVNAVPSTWVELPGEHGYRFFPCFYTHLFDTLKRIPAESDGAERSGRNGQGSVFDQLVSSDMMALMFPDGHPPFAYPRGPMHSLGEAFELQRLMFERMGWDSLDTLRIQTRVLAFLTSCDARRDTYEDITWNEFLRIGDGVYSDAFERAVEHWPSALVGLRGDEADARTFGGVFVHQLFDYVARPEKLDAALNGPTSVAWFDPWRRHLAENLGVTFHLDEAAYLYLASRTGETEVRVRCSHGLGYSHDPSWAERHPTLPADAEIAGPVVRPVLPVSAYLVVATDARETYRLLATLERSVDVVDAPGVRQAWDASADSGWVAGVRAVLDTTSGPFDPRSLGEAVPLAPLRHFTGLQLHRIEGDDVKIAPGHFFLPMHPWGLTGISQEQLRASRAPHPWPAATLSFDIGAFGHARVDETPWTTSRASIAASVWSGVVDGLGPAPYVARTLGEGDHTWLAGVDEHILFRALDASSAPAWWTPDDPDPDIAFWRRHGAAWHLPTDREVCRFDATQVGATFDNNPYMVVRPGAFRRWPGRLEPANPDVGYDVEFGNLLCAGTYTRTFTRMVTMEAANEAARHAVNGVVRHQAARKGVAPTGLCGIHPLVNREPAELAFARRLDEALLLAGLPHLLDVLQVDQALRNRRANGRSAAGAETLQSLIQLTTNLPPELLSAFRAGNDLILGLIRAMVRIPGR